MNNPPPLLVTAQPSADAQVIMRFEAEKKSEGVALFLCWVLGVFGGHRFYLGRPHAVTMLVITIVSIPLCFVLIGCLGLVATWVWMIIDLFSVTKWAKEYNASVMAKITSRQM